MLTDLAETRKPVEPWCSLHHNLDPGVWIPSHQGDKDFVAQDGGEHPVGGTRNISRVELLRAYCQKQKMALSIPVKGNTLSVFYVH